MTIREVFPYLATRAARAARGATLLSAAVAALAGCLAPGVEDAPSLEEVLASVERYRDVDLALADGFFRDPLDTCETPAHMGQAAELGVMGVHYLNRARLGITADETRLDVRTVHLDFLDPAILVYEPLEGGNVELVGMEFIVNAEVWEAAGQRGPPTFREQPFHFVEANPAQFVPAHYDLHIWLRGNPNGPFAPYNPSVSCREHVHVMPMLHPDSTGEMVMPEPHPHIRGVPLSEAGGASGHVQH